MIDDGRNITTRLNRTRKQDAGNGCKHTRKTILIYMEFHRNIYLLLPAKNNLRAVATDRLRQSTSRIEANRKVKCYKCELD